MRFTLNLFIDTNSKNGLISSDIKTVFERISLQVSTNETNRGSPWHETDPLPKTFSSNTLTTLVPDTRPPDRDTLFKVFRSNRVLSINSSHSSREIETGVPFQFSILDIDDGILHRTLNYMEFDYFQRIKPREFLQNIWSRGQLKGTHPESIQKSIAHFNHTSNWVSILTTH